MGKWKSFNVDYFENIDTEDKAYFLGFILADGHIRCKYHSLVIKIKNNDKEILNKFKNNINFEGELWYAPNNQLQIIISSPKLIKDLSKYSIIPNKTNFVEFPEIPKHLENHFMRGVFDGDGCISIKKEKRKGKGGNRGQVNLCSGSKNFIYKYVDKLNEYAGVKKNKIRFLNESYYIIDWAGMTDVENIYHFLYKDATIFLERKKETFDKVYNITKHRTKYRKK